MTWSRVYSAPCAPAQHTGNPEWKNDTAHEAPRPEELHEGARDAGQARRLPFSSTRRASTKLLCRSPPCWRVARPRRDITSGLAPASTIMVRQRVGPPSAQKHPEVVGQHIHATAWSELSEKGQDGLADVCQLTQVCQLVGSLGMHRPAAGPVMPTPAAMTAEGTPGSIWMSHQGGRVLGAPWTAPSTLPLLPELLMQAQP